MDCTLDMPDLHGLHCKYTIRNVRKYVYCIIYIPGRSEKSRMHSLKPLASRRSLSCCRIATPMQKGKEELPSNKVSHRWKILWSGNTSGGGEERIHKAVAEHYHLIKTVAKSYDLIKAVAKSYRLIKRVKLWKILWRGNTCSGVKERETLTKQWPRLI